MIEPLKHLLSIYKTQKEPLLYYLHKDIVEIVKDLLFLNDNNELLLNDILICIKRSTLELEHSGKLISSTNNNIIIKEKSKYSVHLPINKYYIFIKRKMSKKNERDYYKELLKSL
jgi:hypothetical protein